MIRGILVLLLITSSVDSFGQSNDSLKQKPQLLPYWTFWVPGASYFYQGKIIQGSIFSTLEIGGIYFGIKYDKNLKNNSSTPYYNYPLLIGIQAFQTEKLTMFKNQLEVIKYYRPDFKYDDLSEKDLYLAPFKIKNIITPITGGMVLLAAAFLGIEKYNETRRFSEIDKMYFLNRYVDRNQGLAVFGTTSLAMSWSAGVGEEYICRNWMMPLLDYKYGQKKGLIISSAIFGGAHFTNLLFADKPNYKSAFIQVGEATILGYFLGRDVQKRGYNIGPAVAAHMWYDFTLMLGSFLINPKNNFLGVNLKFKI
jgi:membrane protease YdiL (CAAX protease family)